MNNWFKLKQAVRALVVPAVILGSTTFAAAADDVPGVTDTTITIGNSQPYSGPASAFGAIGKTEAAYFEMVNEHGGVNGRMIEFISYDDSYSPPKTIEQVRKLIESDEVFALFNVIGTPTNIAIQNYVNQKEVPHLFISSGASRWNEPEKFPWSQSWWGGFEAEARIYMRYIKENYPDAKIGILYQNDDMGRDYLKGVESELGDDTNVEVVAKFPYELTSVNVDSQINQIKAAGADVFLNFSTPKFATQAIKRIAELDWHPAQFMSNTSASMSHMKIAGLENAQGIISAVYMKDPADPQNADDPEVIEYLEFMAKYNPDAEPSDTTNVFGYSIAKAFTEILDSLGENVTREVLMEKMASLDTTSGLYFDGIEIKTSPEDFATIEQLQPIRLENDRFVPFGPVLSGEAE